MRRRTVVALALLLSACESNPTAVPRGGGATPTGPAHNCWGRPAQSGYRTLASKRTFWLYTTNYCTGYPGWEQIYEFRSDDQWICWTDMNNYYSYLVGDSAECEWYAG